MRSRFIVFGVVLLLLLLVGWFVWQGVAASLAEHTPAPDAAVAEAAATTQPPTATPLPPTAVPTQSATGTPIPTLTPPATATATLLPSATFTATPLPSPTATATATATPTAPPERACPATPPLKPAYNRYYLSAATWPTPDPAVETPHFWLSKPLPGGGRPLINARFPYGWDESGRLLLHNGVDTAEDLGTPLLAVADGTVVVAQSDVNAWFGWRCDWYGHLVVIELDQRWQDQPVYVLYGHVLNITVEPGQRVERGEQVAEIGIGGAAVAPHLHLEVRVGENEFGATRNPMLWLDPGESRGVIAGRLVDPEGRPWQGVALNLLPAGEDAEPLLTWSYLGDPDELANPDEGLAENFVFADVRPGTYEVLTQLQDVEYRVPVTVAAGQVTAVEIVTEPYKTPTPTPESSDVAAPAATETPAP